MWDMNLMKIFTQSFQICIKHLHTWTMCETLTINVSADSIGEILHKL